jgi:hypothetical protein
MFLVFEIGGVPVLEDFTEALEILSLVSRYPSAIFTFI